MEIFWEKGMKSLNLSYLLAGSYVNDKYSLKIFYSLQHTTTHPPSLLHEPTPHGHNHESPLPPPIPSMVEPLCTMGSGGVMDHSPRDLFHSPPRDVWVSSRKTSEMEGGRWKKKKNLSGALNHGPHEVGGKVLQPPFYYKIWAKTPFQFPPNHTHTSRRVNCWGLYWSRVV